MEALIEGAWYLQAAALGAGNSCSGKACQVGVEVEAISDAGPKKGGGPPSWVPPFELSHCLGQGQLREAAET